VRGLPPILEDHFRSPRGARRLAEPSGRGKASNPACGDVLELDVAIDGDRVVDAGFLAHGCSSVIAVASLATEAIRGRTVAEARRFDLAAAVAAAGGLPPTRRHAVSVVGRALAEALGEA